MITQKEDKKHPICQHKNKDIEIDEKRFFCKDCGQWINCEDLIGEMETINGLEKKIERTDKVYGKGFFNDSVQTQKEVLQAQLQTLKDVLILIEEFKGKESEEQLAQ